MGEDGEDGAVADVAPGTGCAATASETHRKAAAPRTRPQVAPTKIFNALSFG